MVFQYAQARIYVAESISKVSFPAFDRFIELTKTEVDCCSQDTGPGIHFLHQIFKVGTASTPKFEAQSHAKSHCLSSYSECDRTTSTEGQDSTHCRAASFIRGNIRSCMGHKHSDRYRPLRVSSCKFHMRSHARSNQSTSGGYRNATMRAAFQKSL